MSESNIDHLLQVTAKVNWATTGPVRGGDDSSRFNDHLAQASTTNSLSPPPLARTYRRSPEAIPSAKDSTANDLANQPEWSVPDDCPEACCDDANCGPYDEPDALGEATTADITAGAAPSSPIDLEAPAGTELGEAGEADGETKAGEVCSRETAVSSDTRTDLAAPVIARDDDPSSSGENEEPATDDSTPSDARRSNNGSQRVVPAVETNSVGENAATDAQAESTQLDLDASTGPTAATTDVSGEVSVRRGSRHEKSGSIAPQTAQPERSAQHRRPLDGETAAASGPASKSNSAQSSDAAQQSASERAGEKRDQHSHESRGDESDATRAARAGSKIDGVQQNKFAEVAPAGNIVQTTTDETTKSDSTDEAVRPTAGLATRSNDLLHPLAKLQRTANGPDRATRNAEGEVLPRVDAARFVGRVARAFHTAQERGGQLQLRLSPPELGALRLELSVKDGALAATLETDNQATRRVLLDHLPALRERLAEQNIRIDRFDVDVRQEGGQSQSAPQHHRHPHPQPDTSSRNPAGKPTPDADSLQLAPTPTNPANDSQINLVA